LKKVEADLLNQYEVVIGNVTRVVELERLTNNDNTENGIERYSCRIVGGKHDVSRILRIEKKSRDNSLVSLDSKIYSVIQTRRTSFEVDFLLNGSKILARLGRGRTTLTEEIGGKSDVTSHDELVSSNFPAKVVSIKISRGDKLKEGDTILVLEAMKMEAQVKAPKNSEVLEIYVREGEIVPRGTKLVRLKFN
jgi:biotin carboxyl carrier protein